MKKTIPFDLFGEKQELCFTITSIGALERMLGKTITQLFRSGYVGFDFAIAALALALPDMTMEKSEEKITAYLTEKKGRALRDIADLLVDALTISGAFGLEAMEIIERKHYPAAAAKGESGKNG